ncbi:MAG: AI-2E family transporter [Omnitrophica WOR_2 bacterium]
MSAAFPRWSSQTKLVVTLLLLALVVYLLYRFRFFLASLALAVILAYILSPLVKLFQNRLRLSRVIATLLCYLLLLSIIAILPLGLFPLLASQFKELSEDAQGFFQAVVNLISNQFVIAGQVIDGTALIQQLKGSLQTLVEPFFGKTILIAMDVISSVVRLVFILVVAFYLIKDGPELRDWIERSVPPLYRPVYLLLREEIGEIWAAFFRGQIILATVVAVIFTAFGFVLGLPFSLAMGVLAGLLEFLPSLGHTIWLVTAALLAFFVGSTWLPVPNWVFALIIIGLELIYQQFDLNYLIPRIIGRRVHLPPLVVILGIVFGAVLAGVLGIALAAPTIASGRVIGRYIYTNLFDLAPLPDDTAPALPPPNPHWWRLSRLRPERPVRKDKG